MNYTQHPLSAAFPSMSADDFQALKDDIEINGQREPVMIFEGMVLDGWHRYRACIELSIKPTQFNFPAEDDPVVFVKSQNLHRRHLTASQRAAAIVACSAWHPAHRQKKQTSTGPLLSGKKVEAASTLPKTNKQIAAEAGVTTRTVSDVKTAQKAGLIDAVRDGALTAEQAAKVARGTPATKPAKPTSKPALTVVAAPQATPDYTELDAAREQIADLQSMLAVANLGTVAEEDKDQAKNLIAELRAEIKTLRATLKAVTTSRDGLMNELAQVKRQCIAQQRELKSFKGNKAA